MNAARSRYRPIRPLFKLFLAAAVICLASVLLYRSLSNYSPREVLAALRGTPTSAFLAALGFAALSYLTLSGFDFFALRYAGRPLPYRKAALASFCSLSIGHTLGFAALSSGAIRYRFYSRWSLSLEEIAKVVAFCATTVGLGMATVCGLTLLYDPSALARASGLSPAAVRGIACACLSLPVAYLIMAAVRPNPVVIRKTRIEMPPPGLAAIQILLGLANYAFVAASLHQAISASGSYAATASAFVTANVLSLISHIPGGVGVFETVIPTILGAPDAVVGVLIFRVSYFLVPLALGVVMFGLAEWWAGTAKREMPTRRATSG